MPWSGIVWLSCLSLGQSRRMHVTLRPGVDRNQLLNTLRSLHTEVVNLRGGGGPGQAQDRIGRYLEWAASAVRHLGNQVAAADIDRLVLTRGYDSLLPAIGLPGTDITTQRVLNGMISLELDQRAEALEAAIKALQAQIERWPLTHAFVVADTSFYIEHQDKLEQADFQSLLDLPGMPVHVLVPIVVMNVPRRAEEVQGQGRSLAGRLYAGRVGPRAGPLGRRDYGRHGRTTRPGGRRLHGRNRLRPARPRPSADQ